MYKTLRIEMAGVGVAVVTIDVPGRTMNVLTPELLEDLDALITSAGQDPSVRGLVLTSGKTSFVAGADLKELLALMQAGLTPPLAYAMSQRLSLLLRRLETLGKPVAAAINGLALGGGLELALACHHRLIVDDAKAVIGLPEVKVGLLPGAGGTQRVMRLIGMAAAAQMITDGAQHAPAAALKLGLVHAVVEPAVLLARAVAWVESNPQAKAPWDVKGFRIPGGHSLTSPAIAQTLSIGTALITQRVGRRYPAPGEILSALYEGAGVPFDLALRIESKHFARLLTGPVARNLVRTLFVHKGELDKLSRRPDGVPKTALRRIGVLGAGMMGAGIAHVAAGAGLAVMLLDATLEKAQQGRMHAEKALEKEVARGRRSPESAAAVLARIYASADYAALQDVDLVIEAVFEDRAVKAEVTARAMAVMPKHAIFASNTSTLPITDLATAFARPKQFIGIHFFSPVEKMPLVEIILGKKTGDTALAAALDLCAILRKTPIVVRDSRGFYTTRVFGTYCQEGQILLQEGVAPALIENAGRFAGMPVGPLAVTDEVSLQLQYQVAQQTRADLGARYVPSLAEPVLRRMVEDLHRLGRKSGGGFYDYPAEGSKQLWHGLAREFPVAAEQPTLDDVQMRLLYIQALEAARCVEEGIVTSPAEADVGSILAIGFPAWTGGTLSLIDTVGIATFVAQAERLARRYGQRFKPSKWLKARAAAGQPFHVEQPGITS
ncbi:MAG: 3-hydroxyacyl-CoA dehydrogenase NAD-binding domain-containing protein [Betaproteobacteria bacterium]